jgi:hypothetical protein
MKRISDIRVIVSAKLYSGAGGLPVICPFDFPEIDIMT